MDRDAVSVRMLPEQLLLDPSIVLDRIGLTGYQSSEAKPLLPLHGRRRKKAPYSTRRRIYRDYADRGACRRVMVIIKDVEVKV